MTATRRAHRPAARRRHDRGDRLALDRAAVHAKAHLATLDEAPVRPTDPARDAARPLRPPAA